MGRKHKLSPNLLIRIRELAKYIIDVHKTFDDLENKDLKAIIRVMATDAKNLMNITDKKTKTYVNRTGKSRPK